MPVTLYRHILLDMLRLLLLSTTVLVVVMSFGSAIKPLSEGLLSPEQLIKVIGYTMPGMLTFALPFCAAFASTLVFFRLCADNEITACAVSGISYRELLMPVLVMGLTLTLGVFVLSNWVVPRFWRLVEQEVQRDLSSFVVQQIRDGNTVKFGEISLFADAAFDNQPVEPPPPPQPVPSERVVLLGVVVTRAGDSAAQAYATAERADVFVYQQDDRASFVTMVLQNVTVFDPESGRILFVKRQDVRPQALPSPIRQQPRFLSLDQLKRFNNDPMLSDAVRDTRQNAMSALSTDLALQYIQNRLTNPNVNGVQLTDPRGQIFLINSPQTEMRPDRLLLGSPDTPVEVRQRQLGLTTQVFTAESAVLEPARQQLDTEPRLTLRLNNVRVSSADSPRPGSLRQTITPLLRVSPDYFSELNKLDLDSLITQADAKSQQLEDNHPIKRATDSLHGSITSLRRDIASMVHERAALAVNCSLVVLLGAVMSMRLRDRIPLVIFFFCFLPAILSILAISQGRRLIEDIHMAPFVGMTVVWGGNTAMAVLTAFVYTKLRRN